MVTGNGWYLTKHSSAVFRARPRPADLPPQAPPSTFRQEVRPVVERAGPATVVSYTVLHDRAGEPEAAVAILEFADGARTVARLEATPPDLADLEAQELVGVRATVTPTDGPAQFDLA
jgi:uncharacterized OB-fold protein